jgi:carbon-monoxide dehydrogenase small subunit
VSRRRVTVSLTVNGQPWHGEVESRKLLADFLREDLRLTGTHLGCEHGVCGACTVLWDGRPARSCLAFAAQTEGAVIETVESLARTPSAFTPIQRAFWDNHALQCGFCTPGFLLTITAFLAEVPDPSREEIREALSGNICRCTGYENIFKAVEQAAAELRGSSGSG